MKLLIPPKGLRYVEALEPHPFTDDTATVFLAGGITACADWQQQATEILDKSGEDVVVLNPRRKNFPKLNNKEEEKKQISWEFDHLRMTDAIMFWFAEETACPITLFEYGKFIDSHKPIFVGTHKNYVRRSDVVIQTELARPDLTVHDSLQKVINDVVGWLQDYNKETQ